MSTSCILWDAAAKQVMLDAPVLRRHTQRAQPRRTMHQHRQQQVGQYHAQAVSSGCLSQLFLMMLPQQATGRRRLRVR
jgi:hypothetical protein